MTLGNKTLEDLLAPISAQLGHTSVPDAPAPREDVATPARVTDELDQRQLVNMFVEEAKKVRVNVHRVLAPDVAQTIASIIAQGESESPACVMGADESLAGLGIADVLEDVSIWNPHDRDASIAAAQAAGYGITFAAAGIAETGTIMQPIKASCGRSVSLLPLVHIAVLDASTVVPTMRVCLETLHDGTGRHSRMPSQVCFISGPSATSDIELVRVEGVHGPMFVHYVLIDDLNEGGAFE